MKTYKWYIIITVFLGLCFSCGEYNSKRVGCGYSNEEKAWMDDALNRGYEYYRHGQSQEFKAVLDSLSRCINCCEFGTKDERAIYFNYLKSRLLYFGQYTNEYDSMLYYGERSKEFAMKQGEYHDAILSMANLGDILRQRGELLRAISEYDKSIRLNDSTIKDGKLYLAIYSGLSCSYTVLRNLDKAETCAKKMEDFREDMSVVDSISYWTMLGNCYYYGEKYDKSLEQFEAMDEFLKKHEELAFDRIVCNVNLADIYIHTGQDEKVGFMLDDAVKFFKDNGITAYLPYIHTLQIQCLLNKGQMAEAITMADECMNELGRMNPDHRVTRLKVLAECMEKSGRIEDAFKFQQQYSSLSDSLRGIQTNLTIAEIEQEYFFDTSVTENKLRVREAELKLVYVVLFVLVGGILLALLVWHMRARIKRAERDKEKALSRILELRNEMIHNRVTPHFIANALAMPNKLTQEDIDNIIFLIRTGLSYDQQVLVGLDKELELVTTYVNVASMTKSENVTFYKEIDPQIEIGKIMIPSMSLLVVVENAIKHGSVGKDNKLKIYLEVSYCTEGILVEIENDGSLDEYYKHRNNTASHGLRMLQQLVELANQSLSKEQISFSIKDSGKGTVISRMVISKVK